MDAVIIHIASLSSLCHYPSKESPYAYHPCDEHPKAGHFQDAGRRHPVYLLRLFIFLH